MHMVVAVRSSALQHHVGFDFDAAEGGACVGGEIRISRSSRHDDDFAVLQGFDGLPLGIEFADGFHADGGEHTALDTDGSECRAESERVDDGGTHSHLVALDSVEALAGS